MDIEDVPLALIDISDANTRKDLDDRQGDSTIDDLARSIDHQGLLQPISVCRTEDGRYAVVAGQRRRLAFRLLSRATIPAIVHSQMSSEDATAVSLVENLHRADMNPQDKAAAFGKLLAHSGTVADVSRNTGVSEATVRKYLQLRSLAPELQERLAAGEARNTDALASLARRFHDDPAKQLLVWDRIGAFRQDIQQDVLRQLRPDLGNLGSLVDRAAEGQLGYHIVRNCPADCPAIPDELKATVAALMNSDS